MPLESNSIDRAQARERLQARLARTSGGSRQPTRETKRAPLGIVTIATGLLETYGLKFIIAVVVVVAFLLALLAGLVSNRPATDTEPSAPPQTTTSSAPVALSNSSAASGETQGSAPEATTDSSETTSTTRFGLDESSPLVNFMAGRISQRASESRTSSEEALAAILEEDLVSSLIDKAGSNNNVAWIASHPEAYAVDGWAVQHKILKLAADEDLAATYVRDWPSDYPAYEQNTNDARAIEQAPTGPKNVPVLFQWDPRWGYTVYSSTAFGMTGCCPTALAMVYQGLTGKTDMTPYDMGMLAQTDGYMSLYEGTDAYFVINEAPGLGLNCIQVDPYAENIVAALESGQVLIVNVGPGDFTTDGHFIVVTGLKDGKLIVNDPYSKVRSDKLWDPQEIADQAMLVLGYTLAS